MEEFATVSVDVSVPQGGEDRTVRSLVGITHHINPSFAPCFPFLHFLSFESLMVFISAPESVKNASLLFLPAQVKHKTQYEFTNSFI